MCGPKFVGPSVAEKYESGCHSILAHVNNG